MSAHFIIGIEGTILSEKDKKRLANEHVVGVILFSRNFDNSAQLRALNHEIKNLRHDLVICTDHEGGRVQRFKNDEFSTLAEPLSLENAGDEEIITHARILALELKRHGVDFSFTPVVDLYNPDSRVINNRSFSGSLDRVLEISKIYIKTLRQNNMPSVLKHFPGHGNITADSHIEFTEEKRTLKALQQSDLKVFELLIKQGLADSIMVGHIHYRAIDNKIASMSSFWLKQHLRQQRHFNGIIFSDDLGMFAAQHLFSSALQACQSFFDAGGDVALLCNDFEQIDLTLSHYNNYNPSETILFIQRWESFIHNLEAV